MYSTGVKMTREEAIKKLHKGLSQKQAAVRRAKTYKGEWYSVNSIFGNDWAMFYVLLGGREAGKSYSAMKWAVVNKLRKGDKFKFYWFRLTEAATKNLLTGGADKFIDPDIKRKYNVNTFTKGSTIYTYTPEEHETKSGKIVKTKENVKPFCDVLACSTFYNTKGVGYFDNEFDGEYYIVLDEMNREQSERNSFDIVYNFVNLLENVARSTKNKIKVVMIGNTLEEASDILSAFNFIPDEYGRYKLKSKRCVVDYIKPNEEYKKRRKGTIADILSPEASTFTNEVEIDRSLLVNKRKAVKISSIIKFGKSKSLWFSLYQGGVIKGYSGESCKDTIAMLPYMDEIYDQRRVDMIRDVFNVRGFTFTNLSTFKRFQKQLRLLKK